MMGKDSLKKLPGMVLCSIVLLLLFFISSNPVIAQKEKGSKDNYREKADSLRKAIWAWDKPAFSTRTIPAEYADASRVIIARHVEILATGNIQRSANASLSKTNCSIIEITREAVKINDRAAITDYSEIAFTRLLKTPGRYVNNTMKTYIGVRVIKPGGGIKEVSADDILLTKDESSIEEAKLAIPDLQVGDIIDYFLAKEQNLEAIGSSDLENYTFSLFDDAPIMHYSMQMQTAKLFKVVYRSYNGAPDLVQGDAQNPNNELEVVKTNIPAYSEGDLWINPFRQLPIIRINLEIVAPDRYWMSDRRPHVGGIYPNPSPDGYIEEERIGINGLRTMVHSGVISKTEGNIRDYYRRLEKNKKRLPFDSLVAELYYLYRYTNFLDVDPNDNITNVLNTFRKRISTDRLISNFGWFLTTKGIEWDMVLVTSRYGPDMDQIISNNDINWLLLAKGEKYKLFGMTDVFSPAFHIPSEYENKKQAITIDPTKTTNPGRLYRPQVIDGRRVYVATNEYADDFYKGRVDIPGSVVSDNSHVETLHIVPAANGSDIQVQRQTTLKGHYKTDLQKRLILFEDFCDHERRLLGEDKTIVEELEDNRKARKSYASELKSAFGQERNRQKDEFIKEAKEWFDQPVTDLTEYKIESLGVRHNNPDFIYSSKFAIGGLVKKAGNNIIIDIGKLQGPTLKVTPNLRKRKLDIYMPFARSIQSQIIVEIPEGYTVEGINELNKKVENKAGSFIVEASSNDKAVTINIKKSYDHTFESIGNWDKLVEIIEAASDWSNSKILLKKK